MKCSDCRYFPDNGFCKVALEKISNRLFTCAYFEEKIDKPDTSKAGKKVYMTCEYCCPDVQLVIVCDYDRYRTLRCPNCGRLYDVLL